METMSTDTFSLFYDFDEQDAAALIRDACEQSIRVIQEHWELDTPEDLRVYVMTSWQRFLFHSAPWPWRIYMAITHPLRHMRFTRIWPYVGGWEQQYGTRRVVGIKPPRLIQSADSSLGARIFIKEADINEKLRQITCHELTHAFASHLKLPKWLNEGLAMVTVDKLVGKPTVKPETLETLARSGQQTGVSRSQRSKAVDQDTMVFLTVHGYWITRYLDETQPELLRDLLAQRYDHKVLEDRIEDALGMSRGMLWSGIDEVVVAHFKKAQAA